MMQSIPHFRLVISMLSFTLEIIAIHSEYVTEYYAATSTKAFFASPGYPLKYPNNLTFEVLVQSVLSTEIIHLHFLECDIEYANVKIPSCEIDQFTVFDGAFVNGSVLYQGCCLNDIQHIQSTGPNVFIQFTSDATITAKGFLVSYYTNGTALEKDEGMSATLVTVTVMSVTVFILGLSTAAIFIMFKLAQKCKGQKRINPVGGETDFYSTETDCTSVPPESTTCPTTKTTNKPDILEF